MCEVSPADSAPPTNEQNMINQPFNGDTLRESGSLPLVLSVLCVAVNSLIGRECIYPI